MHKESLLNKSLIKICWIWGVDFINFKIPQCRTIFGILDTKVCDLHFDFEILSYNEEKEEEKTKKEKKRKENERDKEMIRLENEKKNKEKK